MKKVMVFLAALLMTGVGFAANDSNLTKYSLQSSISSAFKSKANSMKAQHDMHIVYGGEDVTSHHQLVNTEVLA